MFTASDIINDAFDRTGIYPNPSGALPGGYTAMGVKLLRGLIENYNVKNMILSTQRKAVLTADASGIIDARKSTEEHPTAFNDDVASIQKVLVKISDEQAGELEFVPFKDFDLYPGGAWVYTYRQDGSNAYEIQMKSGFGGRSVIVHYNVPFVLDGDTTAEMVQTEFYLPDEYRELFILGLGVKLFKVYPRADEKMENGWKEELRTLTNDITAKQGEAKLVQYNRYGCRSLSAIGDSGTFLMGW